MTKEEMIHDLEALADAFREERGAEPKCLGEAVKELKRYQSMDMHNMVFTYRNVRFQYVESRSKTKIHISIRDGHWFEKDVKPLSKTVFETWCVCWTVDHKDEILNDNGYA